MEGFDNIAMHSYHLPAHLGHNMLGMSSAIPNASMLSLDSLDHHSDYGVDTFTGSEDASQYGTSYHLQPPRSAGLKPHYSGVYDDAFSDVLSNFDNTASSEPQTHDTPSIERDNKLLSFSSPTFNHPILDYAYRPVTASLNAQLHGMFFLAESAFPNPNESAAPQTELTCYRRNLFQVTGSLTLPRGLRYVLTEQGEQIPIVGQELTISATETVEGNPVKIICVPWKTPVTSAPTSDDKSEKEPTSMPIDLNDPGQDMDGEFATFPIAWKRLQFRIATANNGRRKELQQHFVVSLKVMAKLANGNSVSMCEIRSGAIVVRGRSPRNFQSRKDMPISGSGSFGRRREAHQRTPTADSIPAPPKCDQNKSNQQESPAPALNFDMSELQYSPDLLAWNVPNTQPGAMTALPTAFAVQELEIAYPRSTPDLTRSGGQRKTSRPPISLSFVDDDSSARVSSFLAKKTGSRKMSSASGVSKRTRTLHVPSRQSSFSLGPLSAADESFDNLYEYFPLGLDDWMPPVDAVYRPHVVHHTNLPADPKVIKNRSKRYFSEDQPS